MNKEDIFTSTVIRELDHHWFDNTGCQYPLVCPKGTKVKFLSILRNYVGTWAEVEYQGEIKYCFLSHLDKYVAEKKEITYFDAPRCKLVYITDYKMSNGERYRQSSLEGFSKI